MIAKLFGWGTGNAAAGAGVTMEAGMLNSPVNRGVSANVSRPDELFKLVDRPSAEASKPRTRPAPNESK